MYWVDYLASLCFTFSFMNEFYIRNKEYRSVSLEPNEIMHRALSVYLTYGRTSKTVVDADDVVIS